jgi:hypothetical protein
MPPLRSAVSRKKKYRLPTGEPRGDAPGGVYPRGSDAGKASRDDDIRFANNYTANTRKYPKAPYGRYENGSPIPKRVWDAQRRRERPWARNSQRRA